MNEDNKVSALTELFDKEQFQQLNEEISFAEYISRCYENPKLVRTSFQRIYDMIMAKGTTSFKRYRKTHQRYHFFDDPKIPIFGLDETIEEIVDFIHGAAGLYGTERRILLLTGPVGSSKSTICRLLKKGMQEYSLTDEGAWYSYKWVNIPCEGPDGIYVNSEDQCPMNEDPIKLLEMPIRKKLLDDLNKRLFDQTPESERNDMYTLISEGELNPRCRFFMKEFLKRYNGDLQKVLDKHIRVVRMVYSEDDRVGIGTFQPKDEKNQDSTELNGDINFSKIAKFGKDSDPRAFNFDGEFQVANRGMLEFIELLKLAQEFLYDLLGVTQEHNIKPKKFPQITVDLMTICHSNLPEFYKLQQNQYMEALKNRTVKVDVPYLLRWSDETKVLEQDYGPSSITRTHIMPHTLEIASLFAILTRLEDDKDNKIDLVDKAELYDGKSLPGWTEDAVKEMRDKYPDEGLKGISARFVQECISNCLAKYKSYVNVFHVLNEIQERLKKTPSVTDEETRTRYNNCVTKAKNKLEEILKAEVQKALVADENAIVRLCDKYIDNVVAFVNKEKVENPITKRQEPADERLMRSIEEKIDIPEQGCDDFRRSLAAFIGTMSTKKQTFKWDSNPQLKKALEAKIFEDTRDHIKLSALSSTTSVVDPDIQDKIDAIKARMIKQYGYNEQSAKDVLDYVATIFARGDAE